MFKFLPSHTNDEIICFLVSALPDVWYYGINVGTGSLDFCLWCLSKISSFMYYFYLKRRDVILSMQSMKTESDYLHGSMINAHKWKDLS